MRPRHKFRPSESWVLEDRVALSTASVAAEVASTVHNLRLSFNGQFLTTPAQALGGGETLSLTGKAPLRGAGVIRIAGTLKSNPSLPPSATGTTGALLVTSRKLQGSAVLGIVGPTSDLSPAGRNTVAVTFRVVSATDQFLPFAGTHGVGTLLLRSRHAGAPGGVVVGQFSLRLTVS